MFGQYYMQQLNHLGALIFVGNPAKTLNLTPFEQDFFKESELPGVSFKCNQIIPPQLTS